MIEIGIPEENPEIQIEPLRDPVPREEPAPIKKPVKQPSKDPVPA